jgi:NAD(P)-dependent dehydrogenase (short-subunit alcohol dehydrogenase family)
MSTNKVAVFGATGTIGKAIVAALLPKHEVVQISYKQAPYKVDYADADSIRRVLKSVGRVHAIVSAAGAARFAPLAKLTDDDFLFSLTNKLMGQVNLVRIGLEHVEDAGSITLTSGILSRKPMVGSAAISLVNAGLEGFVRAAQLEAPRGIRINVVSPPWVTETLKALNMDPSQGKPAAQVAQAYVRSMEGRDGGIVIDA